MVVTRLSFSLGMLGLLIVPAQGQHGKFFHSSDEDEGENGTDHL